MKWDKNKMDVNVNYSNLSLLLDEVRPIHATAISGVVLLCILLLAILGNSAVILAVHQTPSLRDDQSNIFIINLSITDLASAAIVMISAFVSLVMDRWPFGHAWCNVVCASNYCLIIVSMLTLCFISIDRHQAVAYPFDYVDRVTKPRIFAMIAYSWFQGLVFAIVPVAFNWVEYDYWEVVCAIQWHKEHERAVYYVVTACVVCFLTPGLVLVFCYFRILLTARGLRVSNGVGNQSQNRSSRSRFDHMRKTIRSLMFVIIAYFICTAPFSVTKFIKVIIRDQNTVPPYVNLMSAWVGYFSSAINPLIYGILRNDFRNAFIRTVYRIFCPHRPVSHLVSQTKITSVNSEMNNEMNDLS